MFGWFPVSGPCDLSFCKQSGISCFSYTSVVRYMYCEWFFSHCSLHSHFWIMYLDEQMFSIWWNKFVISCYNWCFLLHLYKTFALLNYRYILLSLKNIRILAFAYSSMIHLYLFFTFVLVYEPLYTCNHYELCMEARVHCLGLGSFRHLDSRDQRQVICLDFRCLNPLSLIGLGLWSHSGHFFFVQ